MKKIVILLIILFFSSIVIGEMNEVTVNAEINIAPQIIEDDDSYETVIVADAVVTAEPFNADSTGVLDSTQAIRDAISYVAKKGGGTVYFPRGRYRITGSINVDNYVTLMGNYVDPDLKKGYGTVIVADAESTLDDLPGLF